MTRVALMPELMSSGGRSGTVVGGHVGYPNPAGNELLVGPIFLAEQAPSSCARGQMPGVYYVPQRIGGQVLVNRAVVTGITGLSGRRLRAIDCDGPTLVDVTGPWR
jgi:hypothetical protein